MKASTIKCALVATIALGAGVSLAQEEKDPIAKLAEEAVRSLGVIDKMSEAQMQELTQREAEKFKVPDAEELQKDAGIQAVVKMECKREKISEKELNDVKKGKDDASTAEAKVRFILKKNGIVEGRTGTALVKIVDVDMEMEKDPAQDENFFLDRDLLSKQAMLMMKGAIVEGIGNQFVASEQFEIFGKTNAIMKASYGSVASAPLFGVTGLAQAESYEKDEITGKMTYHMALAAVWSKKLHDCAKATLLGKKGCCKIDSEVKKPTVTEWVDGLEADGTLAMIFGPRQIIDSEGNRVFLGISASEVGVDSLADLASKEMAKSSAFATLAFSLSADVDQAVVDKRCANTMRQSNNKRNSSADFYKRISQSVGTEENPFVVKGAYEVCNRTIMHPLTRKKIYVSVYAVDSQTVAKAGVILKELIATRIIVELENNRNLAAIAEGERMVDDARKDKESFAEGAAAMRDGVNKRIQSYKNFTPIKKTNKKNSNVNNAIEGVFSGEQKIEADF